jgi:NAD(P)H-hydrate epimerase
LVDLVHYASIPENNDIVIQAKQEFRNGIVVPRDEIEACIAEDDAILIGPGMVRTDDGHSMVEVNSLTEALAIQPEGLQTMALTNFLLDKYSNKQWIIDAGALQMIDLRSIPKGSILTPHLGEFQTLWQKLIHINGNPTGEMQPQDQVLLLAQKVQAIILLKGKVDIVANGLTNELYQIEGGNAGMTKGGTGDVLAGLVAALSCQNEPSLAALAGSFINKRAGDDLFQRVGPFFNASDLAEQIPLTMKELFV